MRPFHVSELLDKIITDDNGAHETTVHLEGPPGISKTSLVVQAAERHDVTLLFFHPLFREPVDLMGVPSVEKGRTRWNPPDYLPDDLDPDSRGIFLIDEMAQAEPPMQKACGRICLEHVVGDKKLPAKWSVITTGNRAGDRAGAHKLLSHLRSRIMRIQVDPSLDDFEKWGIESGKIIAEVRYFLRFKPDLLVKFDASSEDQYATPRTWEMVSRVYPVLPEHLQDESVSGCVGKGPAAEYLAFCKVWRELAGKFSPDIILADPEKAPLPKREQADIMYALTGSIAEFVKDKGAKLITAAFKYMKRLPKEFTMLGCRTIYCMASDKTKTELIQHPEYQKWFKENREIILEASSIK